MPQFVPDSTTLHAKSKTIIILSHNAETKISWCPEYTNPTCVPFNQLTHTLYLILAQPNPQNNSDPTKNHISLNLTSAYPDPQFNEERTCARAHTHTSMCTNCRERNFHCIFFRSSNVLEIQKHSKHFQSASWTHTVSSFLDATNSFWNKWRLFWECLAKEQYSGTIVYQHAVFGSKSNHKI